MPVNYSMYKFITETKYTYEQHTKKNESKVFQQRRVLVASHWNHQSLELLPDINNKIKFKKCDKFFFLNLQSQRSCIVWIKQSECNVKLVIFPHSILQRHQPLPRSLNPEAMQTKTYNQIFTIGALVRRKTLSSDAANASAICASDSFFFI